MTVGPHHPPEFRCVRGAHALGGDIGDCAPVGGRQHARGRCFGVRGHAGVDSGALRAVLYLPEGEQQGNEPNIVVELSAAARQRYPGAEVRHRRPVSGSADSDGPTRV